VAVSPSGYAVVVWEDYNGVSVVKASTKQVGGSWSTPVHISEITSELSQIPQVAVDPAGNAVAVWTRYNGDVDVIESASLPFGGTWTSPTAISSTIKESFSPQVAMDASGNAVAIWTEVTGQIIQGASLPFGGTWTPFVNISSVTDLSNEPQIAIDPSGNAVAVWKSLSGGDCLIQSSTLPFGGSWSLPVNVSSVGTVAIEPQVNVDQSGNAIAVWIAPIGKDIFVQGSFLPVGGSWSAPATLSAAGGQAFNPTVAFDSAGNAIAVWDRFDGEYTFIQASQLPVGGSWTSPVNLSDKGQNSDFPQIAIDPSGYAVVNWTDFTLIVVQAATWKPSP
jgi:hypothetical protein